MAIKAIVFCRVSTTSQDLQAQKATTLTEALKYYQEEEIKIVEGKESGVKLDELHRETINEMKRLINEYPTIESIFFFSVDRLARNIKVMVNVVWDLNEMGINCVFINPVNFHTLDTNKDGKKTENPMAKICLLMMGYAAEQEAKMFKERSNNKKRELIAVGKVASGSVLYGYKKNDDRTIAIDEEKANVIRKLFNLYIEQKLTIQDINFELNKDDSEFFKLGTRQAAISRILKIIKNYAYSGRNKENLNNYNAKDKARRLFSNAYPAIVSKELQDKAIEISKNKCAKPKQHTKHNFYGKGLIKIAETGHIMTPEISNWSYRNSPSDRGIVNLNIGINTIDGLIKHLVYLYLPILESINESNTKEEYKESINKNQEQIDDIQEVIDKASNEIRRIQKLLVKGKVSEDIADEEIKKLNAIIRTNNNKQAELKSEVEQWRTIIDDGIDKAEKLISIQQKVRENKLDDISICKYAKEVIKYITVKRIDSKHNRIDVELNPIIQERITLKPYYTTERTNRTKLYQHNIENDKGIDISYVILKKYKRKY